jgi:hypothetical protein
MTTVIRRKRASRSSIGAYRRHELLTGRIVYPVQGYTGYGDGIVTHLTAFISDEMRADWEANRAELMAFWRLDKTEADVFPDALPWLFVRGSAEALPWAARHLERPRQQSMMMSSEFSGLRRGMMSLIREESLTAMGGEISDPGMQGLNIELHGHSLADVI